MGLANDIRELDFPLEVEKLLPSYRIDTKTSAPDLFEDISVTDWSTLAWEKIGKPYNVEPDSRRRAEWENVHNREMPVQVQWEHFNRYFHDLFIADVPSARRAAWRNLLKFARAFDASNLSEAFREYLHLAVWNKVHRSEDAVWDPRGKRALFEGLNVKKPEILFLGAADGYEAMQLMAMYPGGHAVLVDYDDFCRTDRFGKFPDAYPFVGKDPATGNLKTWRREDFDIDFVVDDCRNLKYGKEFDIVVSIGLIEHFPDEMKPEALEWHRKFLKPGGYVIMTTPRKQWKSKMFYTAMGELMNFGYRELMDAYQLGLYAYEGGFDILRAGYIKAHNGVITRVR